MSLKQTLTTINYQDEMQPWRDCINFIYIEKNMQTYNQFDRHLEISHD